jgi:acetolactate synthase-1/2/3 large subunit
LGRNYPTKVSLLADAKVALNEINQALDGRHSAADSWGAKASKAVLNWREEQKAIRASDTLPVRGERLAQEVQAVLPAEASLVVDTGFSAIWGASIIELTKPSQRFFRPAGGSLGWGFPASLGVKCAVKDQPVVCFTGDGAFWYHLNELETAVRHDINTVTVLNNNGGLGQCYRGIRATYGDIKGRPEEQYSFQEVDFSQLARDIGAGAIRIEKASEIAPALTMALEDSVKNNRPYVVEVITDITSDPQNY